MDNPVLWTLIAVQVAMGAFDTLYHHEGTERLAWRPSQKNELRLHGVRNIFYAAIFVCFGWFEPHGAFTIALALILGVEVLITLWDFVEEDLTRKLPASERVNHTLLALNYGAILALAAPYLYDWALRETAVVPTNYGWWSGFASLSALGVFIFGIRDLLAAARSDRLLPPDAERLVAGLTGFRRVLVTGGTGFIGTRLVQALVAGRHKVTVLTRDKAHAESLAGPVCVITGLDQVPDDERFDVVVNLAGDPVANSLWSPKKRAEIIASRVDITRQLVALIARLDTKPECLISGSAIGWYGLRDDEDLTEDASAQDCFVHQVCARWEHEASAASRFGVRVVALRTGLVLGVEGGMLARLLTPFEFGLGGPLGAGKQWMSWIALDDVVRMIAFVIANRELAGPVNATAPNPVTNEVFTRALAASLNRPAILRVPARLLELALGDLAREALLAGQKVLPEKVLNAGFHFLHADIHTCLDAITGKRCNPGRNGSGQAGSQRRITGFRGHPPWQQT